MKNFTFLMVFFLFSVSWAYAQRTVQGTVKDTDGEPLIGASVYIKGTTSGTVTDIDGKYSITVPEGSSTLMFRFTGFTTKEVELGSSNTLNVTMELSISDLSEVVVVGYGTQIKSELTGNIASVSAEQIADVPVPSVEMALQGKTAGVVVEGLNGKPGQVNRIRIRGSASIQGSNQPLIVIDGVPMSVSNASGGVPLNPLADINPNDIASVDVLKDASAAAIYGSRGANGVIIITTKSGQDGVTKVNASFQVGMSQASGRRDFLNAEEYVELLLEGAANADELEGDVPGEGFWTGFVIGRLDRYSGPSEWRDNETDTDWQDLAFRNALFVSTDVNVSGGNKLFNYYISLGYTDQEGILVGNSFDRYSSRLNLNGKSKNEKLEYGINLGVSRTRNDRVSNDNAFSTPLQLVAQAPITPVRNFTDDVFQGAAPGALFDRPVTNYYNGLIHVEDVKNITTIIRTLANVYASYQLVDGLKFRAEFGVDNSDLVSDQFFSRRTNTGEASNGLGFYRNARVFNYNTKLVLNYVKTLGKHSINAIGGIEFQKSTSLAAEVEGQQYALDDLKTIANAAEITAGTSTGTEFSFFSYFARVNYSFDGKYLVTASVRADGSSRFGADNRFGVFPAVGLGWVMSNEDFLSSNRVLSFLKLRASWGITGNAEIGNFPALGLYGSEGYNGIAGLQPTNAPNPELKWENTAQVDIGIDFGFFKNRINGELDYYVKNTSDLLLFDPEPATSGFTGRTRNVGKIKNQGFEFLVNTVNTTGEVQWTTSFNGAINRNEVTELADGQTVIDNGGINVVEVGKPLGYFKGVEYAGVDPANGDALFYLNTVNPDGSINRETTNDRNAAEFVDIGNPTPDFVGGLTNTVSYKGIELSFTVQWATGHQINNQAGRFQEQADWVDNSTRRMLDRWQNPGDITDVPRIYFAYGNGGGTRNSRYVQNADYLKMRDISLGYRFQPELLSKIKLTSLRVFVSARNLFTITGYDGWDPEVTSDSSTGADRPSNVAAGNDFYSAPMPRTYTFGVNIGF